MLTNLNSLEKKIEERMGVLPSFFLIAKNSPDTMGQLWQYAENAYLNFPLPSLIKEQIFTYLSKFCTNNYCFSRHAAFLLGNGHISGDKECAPMKINEFIKLYSAPLPTEEDINDAINHLALCKEDNNKLLNTDEFNKSFILCSIPVFLFLRDQKNESYQYNLYLECKNLLIDVLGSELYNKHYFFLMFIDSAHSWTLLHPEIAIDDDVRELFKRHPELSEIVENISLTNQENIETNYRNRIALDSLKAGVWDWDITNETLVWNEQMYEIYQIKSENISNCDGWGKYIHPEDFDNIKSKLFAALNGTGSSFDSEFRILINDNESHHINVNAEISRDSYGKAIRMIGINKDVTDLKNRETKLVNELNKDYLTNLTNRREFDRRLGLLFSSAQNSNHSICYLDIDKFKLINDTKGHDVADNILREVSIIMSKHTRSRDTLARIGGDEFSIIFEHCSISNAEKIVSDLINDIQSYEYDNDNEIIKVTMSIGLTSFNPSLTNMDDVLKNAEKACYQAKSKGRNNYQIISSD
ncbi:MAG: diguanylate cyclase [Gammaproteobacteria bacterium]|jgi:diguanylate cyclase (GGDEF)-like protein